MSPASLKSGPNYAGVESRPSALLVSFPPAKRRLRFTERALSGFEILGEDLVLPRDRGAPE